MSSIWKTKTYQDDVDVRAPPLKSDDHVSITIQDKYQTVEEKVTCRRLFPWQQNSGEKKKKKQVAFNKFQVF